MAFPLELSGEQMQEMGQAAVDFIASFVDGLEASPANGWSADPNLREALLRGPGESASDFGVLFESFKEAASLAVETAGPRFVGLYSWWRVVYLCPGRVPCPKRESLHRTPDMAPELVAMEHGVLQWLCREFRLPKTAGGLITTGGSMATLSAVVAARSQRLGENFADGTIYVTDFTHHCVRKAGAYRRVSGSRYRKVPVRTTYGWTEEGGEDDRAGSKGGAKAFLSGGERGYHSYRDCRRHQ